MNFKRVILESPYAGKGLTPEEIAADKETNIRYAKAAARDALSRGEAPMVSHLLYTQMLDDDVKFERDWGIGAGLAWGEFAEKTVVYDDRGVSRGMAYGITKAQEQSRPVEYRKVPGWKE